MRGLSLLPTFLSLFWFSQQCSSFCLVQTSSSRFVHMASTSDLVQSCLVSSFRPPPLAGQQGGWAGVRGATRFPPTISCSSGGGSSGSSGNGISVLGKSLKSAGKKLREKLRTAAAFGTDVVLHPLKEILFRRWSRKFIEYRGTVDERARWEGKVALVTGGSGGIGMQAAAGLAARGYSVIIACRDAEKGKRACEEIALMVPGASVEAMPLDLSSIDSVRHLARAFNSVSPDGPRALDVLVNNAGYGGGGQGGITDDGLEWYFQVNHLGHFLLAHLLWPSLSACHGRVVSLSSVMHWGADETFPSDLASRGAMLTSSTGPGGEYRRSKLYNLLFTYGIARRFAPSAQGGVSAHAVNPGFVYSDIWRHEANMRMRGIYKAYCKTTQQGAEGIIRAATEETYANLTGVFLVDAQPAGTSELAKDEEACEWLWGVSEGLAGVVTFGSPSSPSSSAGASDAAWEEAASAGGGSYGGAQVIEVGSDLLASLSARAGNDAAEVASESSGSEGFTMPPAEAAEADPEVVRREAEAIRGMGEVTRTVGDRLREVSERASRRLGGA